MAMVFAQSLPAYEAAGGAPALGVDEVVRRAQEQFQRLKANLPDFICFEKVVSRSFIRGWPQKPVVVVSRFTGRQVPDPSTDLKFRESRVVKTVNGHPPPKGWHYDDLFSFGGGFSSALATVIGAHAPRHQTYHLGPREWIEGKPALVVFFVSKPRDPGLFIQIEGRAVPYRDSGKAWIDPVSFEVLRLQLRLRYATRPPRTLTVEIVYREVEIAGGVYPLPAKVIARQPVTRSLGGRYLAQYSDYRKFTTDATIEFPH